MNKEFYNEVAKLENDIIKLAQQLKVTIEHCKEQSEKRILIEKKRLTKGRDPNIETFIGGAYMNVQAIYRLQKHMEFFVKKRVKKEDLESIIYLRYRLASEAYGVALGGHELKIKNYIDKDLRNHEWCIYAAKIKKENSKLTPSEVIQSVINKFGLSRTQSRTVRRAIFNK